MDFWPFVCFSLKFSPLLFSQLWTFFIYCTVSGTLVTLTNIILPLLWLKRILMVCTSCKTSYNVLISGRGVNLHWGGGGGGGGGGGARGGSGKCEKESHQILDSSLEVGTSVMPLYSICTSNLPLPPTPNNDRFLFYSQVLLSKILPIC